MPGHGRKRTENELNLKCKTIVKTSVYFIVGHMTLLGFAAVIRTQKDAAGAQNGLLIRLGHLQTKCRWTISMGPFQWQCRKFCVKQKLRNRQGTFRGEQFYSAGVKPLIDKGERNLCSFNQVKIDGFVTLQKLDNWRAEHLIYMFFTQTESLIFQAEVGNLNCCRLRL